MSELFSCHSGLDPPPPPRQTRRNFQDPRMYIPYRGGRETIALLKTFCRSLTKVHTFAIVYIYVHQYVKKLNLNFKVASQLS